MRRIWKHLRKPRFRVRTLLLMVALCALGFGGIKIVRDGPETHWQLLKLQYGPTATRRAVATELSESVALGVANSLFGAPRYEQWLRSGQRRADLVTPALCASANDPDLIVRLASIKALAYVTFVHGTKAHKTIAFRQLIEAALDPDVRVRLVALDLLVIFADQDSEKVIQALQAALREPTTDVRIQVVRSLGIVGLLQPNTQPKVVPILVEVLAGEEPASVRKHAVWSLSAIGVDQHRHAPGSGPDVVPALIAALQDPSVEIRRASAEVLCATSNTHPFGGVVSAWEQRKAALIPALQAALWDEDSIVQQFSTLALLLLGVGDAEILERVEQVAIAPEHPQQTRFANALTLWRANQVLTGH